MSNLLDHLSRSVLLCDGAMGTRIQELDLSVDKDFGGHENCTDILTRTRPDLIRSIHAGYLAAGADILQTNTFGASPVTLGEFGIGSEAFSLNREAAELAREAVEQFADGRKRYVLGDIGPGTKLPSLGHIEYQALEDALTLQCAGLIAGRVDGFLIETCQDPLQIKAAVNGAKRAMQDAGSVLPIFVQVTVETTGTLLVGADIAAAATIVQALDVQGLGINCATGPAEMVEHVKWLGENWPGIISVQPNAGLPRLVDGQQRYPLAAHELAGYLETFVTQNGVNLIGGCCGTSTQHIAALDEMLRRLGSPRPAPVQRKVFWTPSIASLYGQVPLRQENAYLSIGERCNANGSRAFRDYQAQGNWDGCVALGVEQVKEGSHALDVCTAFVGRKEKEDMIEVVSRLRGSANAPLVFDSTELPVLEAALKLYGGKPVINSINFEDGEAPAEARLRLAKRFGAAVIALTIDEQGMAKSVERKIEVAKRLYKFAVERHGLAPSDLIFDPLTFTICTGTEDDRRHGISTLEAIERLRAELPECQVVLGLSNISFGLRPAARHTLNSAFLDHALRRGLTGAILHHGKIRPSYKIPPEEVAAAEDLIFDRRREGYDPLQFFLGLFEGRSVDSEETPLPDAIEERLSRRIIDGNRVGLEGDLEEAVGSYSPLDIINRFLLDGMKVVGDLFGSGKMQLPFVLQSAETMKAAVAYLEPKMDRTTDTRKGTIVVATVKGDVHDIGKNLVDIILTNNGYAVINLGIKQPIANILAAAKEHKADAIGMSGLLVKSTVIMRENLETMTREGVSLPVLLGGAALTRSFVEQDCAAAYQSGHAAYANSAFDGLDLMAKVVSGTFVEHVEAAARKRSARKQPEPVAQPVARPIEVEESFLKRSELQAKVEVPQPPFWGARRLERIAVESALPYLNETMLFRFHWGFRSTGQSAEEFKKREQDEVKPLLTQLVDRCLREDILQLTAAYGYWPAAGDGNDLVVFGAPGGPEEGREIWRFTLPRQNRPNGVCIADFFRDIKDDQRDVIGLQVVTAGQRVADVAREWLNAGHYRDYLFLHGLGVEMAEALAEQTHARIRAELGFAHSDDPNLAKMIKHGYRGSRYSFGYPACPNLADQHSLLKLLEAEKCGITISEEDQLWPEQSTSAIVVHHPQARYFAV